ncbi:carrier protein ymc1 [Balamuthia mandrillaris]
MMKRLIPLEPRLRPSRESSESHQPANKPHRHSHPSLHNSLPAAYSVSSAASLSQSEGALLQPTIPGWGPQHEEHSTWRVPYRHQRQAKAEKKQSFSEQKHEHHFSFLAPYKHFVGGSAGGMVGLVVGYPFETIRVRLQTQNGKSSYANATDCALKTLRSEGPLGFYKGMLSPLLGITLVKTVSFGAFGSLKRLLFTGGNEELDKRLAVWKIAIAAAGAGIINTAVVTPIDRIKIILQLQTVNQPNDGAKLKEYMSRMKSLESLSHWENIYFEGPRDVAKHLGLKGLYKGLSATMLRDAIGYGTYFTTYEALKRLLHKRSNNRDKQISFPELLLAGGLTGVVCWTAQYPLDVVKSRMQASLHPPAEAKSVQAAVANAAPRNMQEVALDIWRSEGAAAFFKGWRPAVVRAFPVHASILTTYDLVSRFLSAG